MERVTLLHINDLHSHLEQWPVIRRWFAATSAAGGANVLRFDDGDALDRVHPLTEVTRGGANVGLMNAIDYTAATVGNNEGIGLGHDELNALYAQANFPVVLANLFEPDGTRPVWAQPYIIRTTEAGARIGIIGLTAPYYRTYEPNGWKVVPANDVLPDLLAELAGQTDVIILLSHLGLPVDRYLAKTYPQLNVIIGGHTHHLLPDGELVGTTMLTGAGRYGQYVGRVDLELDASHNVANIKATTFATADMAAKPEDAAEIDAWWHDGEERLRAQQVARLPVDLTIDYDAMSPLLECGLAAVAEAGGTDAALLNSGLFLHDLKAGIVTEFDLHTLLPHAMHVMHVTLPGRELWRLVMEAEKNRMYLRHFPQKGMGFRGKIFGDLGYHGLELGAGREVLLNGVPLEPERIYTVSTVDHWLFVPYFPTIEIVGDDAILFPDLLRNVVGKYLAEHYPLT